jgi:ribosome-associated protein
MQQFNLAGREFVELDNILKILQLCDSGGMAKRVIAEGHVKVNGNVELRKRCKIRSGQIVEFEGHKIVVE